MTVNLKTLLSIYITLIYITLLLKKTTFSFLISLLLKIFIK